MTLFRIDTSIRQEGSVSRELADTVQRTWTEQHPDDKVVRRDLVVSPVPHDAWQQAVAALFLPAEERSSDQLAAGALAAELADELIDSEAILIASPLYNFGVSQHLKTWIDLVITDPRFAPGRSPLAGKPVTVVVARGGGYGSGTPREGWDHATPYVRRIFGDVLGGDVTVVTAELTLADVTPAMADLRDLAATSRTHAHELAATTGRNHARQVAARRAGAADDLSGVA